MICECAHGNQFDATTLHRHFDAAAEFERLRHLAGGVEVAFVTARQMVIRQFLFACTPAGNA